MNPFEEAVIHETRRQFFSRTARGLGVTKAGAAVDPLVALRHA